MFFLRFIHVCNPPLAVMQGMVYSSHTTVPPKFGSVFEMAIRVLRYDRVSSHAQFQVAAWSEVR